MPQHLPSVMVGLVDYTREGSEKVPVLRQFGPDVTVGSVTYDPARATLTAGYTIIGDQSQVEFAFSPVQGWEVSVQTKAAGRWSAAVLQSGAGRLVLRITHAPLTEELIRYRVSIESTSASAGVRVNGVPTAVEPLEPPAPKRPLLEDVGSGISLRTFSTMDSVRVKRDDRELATEKSIASLVRRNYICE